MERAADALCVEPGQRAQVLRMSAWSRVVRGREESMDFPVYRCLGESRRTPALGAFRACIGCVCGVESGTTCEVAPYCRYD